MKFPLAQILLNVLQKVSKFAFPTFMNLITNKCPSSRTNPQNRVRFPLAMCIYSKGINPKIISKTRTNVRKPIEIHKKM